MHAVMTAVGYIRAGLCLPKKVRLNTSRKLVVVKWSLWVHLSKGHVLVCLFVSPQHRAYAKAFSLYTDMLNNRVTGEVQEALVIVYIHRFKVEFLEW